MSVEDEHRGFDAVPALWLDVKLGGRQTTAFVDTGAGISLASLRLIRYLGLEDMIDPSVTIEIQGIHEATQKSAGKIHRVSLEVGGGRFEIGLNVVPGATMDFILGIDWMTENRVRLDFRNGLCYIGSEAVARFMNGEDSAKEMAEVRNPTRFFIPDELGQSGDDDAGHGKGDGERLGWLAGLAGSRLFNRLLGRRGQADFENGRNDSNSGKRRVSADSGSGKTKVGREFGGGDDDDDDDWEGPELILMSRARL